MEPDDHIVALNAKIAGFKKAIEMMTLAGKGDGAVANAFRALIVKAEKERLHWQACTAEFNISPTATVSRPLHPSTAAGRLPGGPRHNPT